MSLTLTPLTDIPLVSAGDDLTQIILQSLESMQKELKQGDVLVLAQKIVSKAEGRLVNLSAITPSNEANVLAEETGKDARVVELILGESQEVLRTRPGLIIVEHKLGFVCANAGIDHSNVGGPDREPKEYALLLPEDPDASAREIRNGLEAVSGVDLGILIIDSHGRSWRLGTVGVAIGISGVPGLVDLRGKEDLFGYTLQSSEVGAADELAAGASLVMGQAAEGSPVVHARGFPYDLREAGLAELIRSKDEDLFR